MLVYQRVKHDFNWAKFRGFQPWFKTPRKKLVFNFQFRQGDRYTLVTALNNLDHLDPENWPTISFIIKMCRFPLKQIDCSVFYTDRYPFIDPPKKTWENLTRLAKHFRFQLNLWVLNKHLRWMTFAGRQPRFSHDFPIEGRSHVWVLDARIRSTYFMSPFWVYENSIGRTE